jgi:small conductance mechanosensitive channel
MTKDFSFYVIELAVPYDEDTDRVIAVAVETTAALRREPKYGASMLEPLEVLGVDGFGNPQVTVKVRVKTAPLKQWEVGRELRRRLNKAFQAKGIRLAVPQMNVAVQQPQQPPPASASPAAPASTSASASASDDKAAPDAKPAP